MGYKMTFGITFVQNWAFLDSDHHTPYSKNVKQFVPIFESRSLSKKAAELRRAFGGSCETHSFPIRRANSREVPSGRGMSPRCSLFYKTICQRGTCEIPP